MRRALRQGTFYLPLTLQPHLTRSTLVTQRNNTMANLRYFLARAAILTMAVLKSSHGFYVPGVRPYEFAPGEEVPMKVNALTSIHTQVRESLIFVGDNVTFRPLQ